MNVWQIVSSYLLAGGAGGGLVAIVLKLARRGWVEGVPGKEKTAVLRPVDQSGACCLNSSIDESSSSLKTAGASIITKCPTPRTILALE